MRSVSASLVFFCSILSVSCVSDPKAALTHASQPQAVAIKTAEAAVPKCQDNSFCTREYLPTVCKFQGQSFSGSNLCETKKLVKRYACEHELVLDDKAVSCEAMQARKSGSAR